MLLEQLRGYQNSAKDEYAARLAQGRTFSHIVRDVYFTSFKEDPMSLADKMKAKAAAARAKKGSKPTTSAKPASKKAAATAKQSHGRKSRATDTDKNQVVKMYNAGKTSSEISDAMGWTEKGDWPYQYTLGVIRQLRKAGRIGYRADKKSKK